VRQIPHPFADRILAKIAKDHSIPDADLELGADSLPFDEELRDGGRQHGLGANHRVAAVKGRKNRNR
jgi:hypothetical protein